MNSSLQRNKIIKIPEDSISINTTETLPDLNPNNKVVMDNYDSYIREHPDLLPMSEVFEKINELWPILNTAGNDPTLTHNEKQQRKDDEKDKSINILFQQNDALNAFFENPLSSPLDNITLTNNPSIDLYYFFTKVLYYTSLTSFNNGSINISSIKDQLGRDIPRARFVVNGDELSREQYLDISQDRDRTDMFNRKLIISANEQKTLIDQNIINIIDICCIQQLISFLGDSILDKLAGYGISQKGGAKTTRIFINSEKKEVDFFITSSLKNINYIPDDVTDISQLPVWGEFICTFKMDISNLSYSLKVSITKELSSSQVPDDNIPQSTIQKYKNQMYNIGTRTINYAKDKTAPAINYIKENPSKVATGVGTTAIGATVGTLLATGLFALGGKTKKRLHKKRKNRKTIHKNKRRKTNKKIHKNKKNKTKRTQK
jgi:hypothetical protein